MRILLAGGQPEARASLRLLLEATGGDAGWAVAGEAAAGQDVLAQAQALEPDVVLLDWELPGTGRADGSPASSTPALLLAALRAVCPAVKVVALSVRPEASAEAQRAGADAFVGKGEGAGLVLDALRALKPESRRGFADRLDLSG